ncbi:MAG: hypothetical protein AAGC68_05510, partial [Verrucomicrobiota bacterium]
MSPKDSYAALEHCSSVLRRVTVSMEDESMDWLVLPDAKSIGEIFLHMAAFEFLMISAIKRKAGKEIDHELWQQLKAGFSREAGFDPPAGISKEDYFELIDVVRMKTRAFFEERDWEPKVPRENVDIAGLAQELALKDTEVDPSVYDRLRKGVGTSFVDDGAVLEGDSVDMHEILRLHETYHRGQITFQKYLRA